MGSTWKCSAGSGGALQVPTAGLHVAVHRRGSEVRQLVTHHPQRKITCVAADIRSVWSSAIWVSRRKIRQSEQLGHRKLGSCRFLTLCAHSTSNGSGNASPESSRTFDREGDSQYAELQRSSVFQDYGGEEEVRSNVGAESPRSVDGNGQGYMELPRGGSNPSDLFREEIDSVWPEEDANANGVGYESWGDEESDEKSTDSASSTGSSVVSMTGSAADSLAIGGKDPVYQVLEIHPDGDVVQREVSRRQLLRKIAGLRLRDIRSVDPSLWVTNSVPAILVRDQAILLNLGSLRAIGTPESVLIFEHKSVGAEAFMAALLPRLRTANNGQGPIMPFELEVVEAALISRTQRLERMLMDVEPRVMALLKVLPNRYTADVLEELRLGKQALVELAAKAGALRQMLLELLEHPEDIRKMTIMGRTCNVRRTDGSIECALPLDKQSAEDEEEEIEMLLEYYLQRCDSCHGQANKLLDAAKEMEDSIGVNLSSRRLEVSRLELLLQVGTFCAALGALVAGIFGMNLKSYLEEHVLAFYITTAGILFGGAAVFSVMFTYLKGRKIL